jgi:membrane fusion protein (multidrug efflux system)
MATVDSARRNYFGENISVKKILRWLIIIAVILAAGVFGYRYWRNAQLYASTDNAYINANRVDISSQVMGPVIKVYINENQQVNAGDPLFDIDPKSFQLALEKTQAQLQLATQSVSQQGSAVAAAQALVAQRQAELNNAQSNYTRFRSLVAQGFYSAQGGEAARTQVTTATAALHAAQANLEQARSALGQTGNDNANIQAAVAAVEQAKLDLQNTHVMAPANGVIANLSLRPGDMVQPGVPQFVLIGSNAFWVDANFKETELDQIRSNQRATIEVDMYPDHVFHGVVESLSRGSGTAFSLLPPQNATGNWVKVTQRVPVRVRVLDPDPRWPLRIGTTATVSISIADQTNRQNE